MNRFSKQKKSQSAKRQNLLSFSPQGGIIMHNRQPAKIKTLKPNNSTVLYDIYHRPKNFYNKQTPVNRQQCMELQINPQFQSLKRDYLHQQHLKNTKYQNEQANLIKYAEKNNDRSFSSQLNHKDKLTLNVSRQIKSITPVYNFMNHFTSRNKQSHQNNTQNLNSTLSYHSNYTSQKQSMLEISYKRLQNQKDLSYLSRTMYNAKRDEEKYKQKLLKTLHKKVQTEQKNKGKSQWLQKRQAWLDNQKNQNHTNKYMNHLLKYHAKNNQQSNNQLIAQQIRERSRSASSAKSMSSLNSRKNLLQQASLNRQNAKQRTKNSRINSISRINARSNSVRQDLVQVYQSKSELQRWKIQKLTQKQRTIAMTIQNSRKNKQKISSLLNQANKYDSKDLIIAINSSMHK